MTDHPIQSIMETALRNIKDMIDVNTIVGDAVETSDGTVIIPVSKVAFGFGVGGSDFHHKHDEEQSPFGGGSGGGVTISPVAFMVVSKGQIKLITVNPSSGIYDKILEMIPDAIDKISEGIEKIKTKNTVKTYEKTYDDQGENYEVEDLKESPLE